MHAAGLGFFKQRIALFRGNPDSALGAAPQGSGQRLAGRLGKHGNSRRRRRRQSEFDEISTIHNFERGTTSSYAEFCVSVVTEFNRSERGLGLVGVD